MPLRWIVLSWGRNEDTLNFRNFDGDDVMIQNSEAAQVLAVSKSEEHVFSKPTYDAITLVAGLGVEGDAHSGKTVKHRSRVAIDPSQPNLRQVHLIHSELYDELIEKGFSIGPGDLGENVTTRGINLLELPRNTLIHIGEHVVIEVTGLRNPCKQIECFQEGLLKAVIDKTSEGEIIRKTGIMGIVLHGGVITIGDAIRLNFPAEPHHKLECV